MRYDYGYPHIYIYLSLIMLLQLYLSLYNTFSNIPPPKKLAMDTWWEYRLFTKSPPQSTDHSEITWAQSLSTLTQLPQPPPSPSSHQKKTQQPARMFSSDNNIPTSYTKILKHKKETRTDYYIRARSKDYGIKLRGGTNLLELKSLISKSHLPYELWQKSVTPLSTSTTLTTKELCNLAKRASYPVHENCEKNQVVAVAKYRVQIMIGICTVECATLRIEKERWRSVCVESLERRGVEAYSGWVEELIGKRAEECLVMGYPEWIELCVFGEKG